MPTDNSPAVAESHRDVPSPRPEREALVRECFSQYHAKLVDVARGSIEMTGDLFEMNTYVSDADIQDFRSKRAAWLEKFGAVVRELFDKRMAGARRKGRRPDYDASIASLRVLTAFDHEKQAALTIATSFLGRFTRRETDALDLRIETLIPDESHRDFDNPFAPVYILDAIGVTSRAIYPNPRVWRPLMERLVSDITPVVNKIYISLNRFLADHGVLPEIKAALRARSEFRPADDRDLLPTFTRMLHETGQFVPTDIVVPDLGSSAGPAPLQFASPGTPGAALANSAEALAAAAAAGTGTQQGTNLLSSSAILAALAQLAQSGVATQATALMPARAPAGDGDFPDLDPMMALGQSSPLFMTLGQWQRMDLPAALLQSAPQPIGGEVPVVPMNLIPHIRAAVGDQISSANDHITMDVIALLFDYIFRDPSIPDSLRNLFGRLQVPIVKAALLDRSFFSDRKHPARRLLDQLADAAVGAGSDEHYRDAFRQVATEVIDDVCLRFEIDISVLSSAVQRLETFIDSERTTTATALDSDVAAALAAEESEADRSFVRALVRDRLAGLDLPFDVRSFAESVWADYLAEIRRDHGADSAAWNHALGTLDDLLWSIVAKERTGQKARLAKMIPALVVSLRKGCTALKVSAERAKAFFDSLYQLHVAAIKPRETRPAEGAGADAAQDAGPATVSRQARAATNVHDFVSEMIVGTWLAFEFEDRTINARLSWVSPLRTKYIFTSRTRSRAFVFSPEDLAYQIGSGKAALVVEPVPLFDRAVSAALDTLAARAPPKAAAAAPA